MSARLAVPLLFCIALSACQSTDDQHIKAAPTLLNDSLFPSYALFPVESSDEIFYLDEDAQFFAAPLHPTSLNLPSHYWPLEYNQYYFNNKNNFRKLYGS